MTCYDYIQNLLFKFGDTFDNIRSAVLDGETVDLKEFKDVCQSYIFTDAEAQDFECLSNSQRVVNSSRFTVPLVIAFNRVACISVITIEIPESIVVRYHYKDFKCLTCEHYTDMIARNRCYEGLACPKTSSVNVYIPEKYRSKVLIDRLYYILTAYPELKKYTQDFYDAVEAINDLTNIKNVYTDDPEDIDAIASEVAECCSNCHNCSIMDCDSCHYNNSVDTIECEG